MTNGEIGLEFLDCVVMPDYASNRIGAVLFEDKEDGTVTFKLETDEHIIYNCSISVSVDGGNVAFVITDDLQ